MEFVSLQAAWAIIAIILIDIVLAGDNALVIGMAANRLPSHLKRRAIFWGTFGAIAIRFVSVALITYLLMIPGLRAIGAVALIYIGWKLAFDDGGHEIEAKDTLRAAIMTIVIADAVMGIDNALGIAAAANGNWWLIIGGLLISVPIIVFGAGIVSRILERHPKSLYIGSFVLFAVALLMFVKEPMAQEWLSHLDPLALKSLPWLGGLVIVMLQYNAAELKIHKRWLIKGNKNV
jgi:YjbE family integral membrane protein